ncbi:MAG: nucleotidyltransferase domain-containing protein [Synergistaceae bacterium]|nr:nucleotidyltransferase domain-containing protein [Synergistaceae bacterium]
MDHPARRTLADKDMFDDIVKAILSVMGDDAVKIILYGSVARGDNTWESDIDIAVLTAKYYRWDAFDDLWEYGLKYDALFQIIPIEESMYNRLKPVKLFYRNIEKDGIVLWSKEAA